ncbi:MGMT family protein [Luteococcus peritonei]|uniref:MGMT family protein n=1 Tax=Luteococcus peritonei TaxID=88874 RepID=A0ABW4RWA9_9ACTN
MDELLVERVLRAVELVPAGRVASYGDIATLVGTGPRQVGRVMAHWGSDVAWWRITNASGDFPPHLLERARDHWADEGVELRPGGRGCRIASHRADLEQLALAWHRATRDLPADD